MPVMAPIEPGTVTLSDRRTERRWTVTLLPYEIGVFPVTREEYGRPGDPRLPVADVSWLDAVACCNALSAAEELPPAYEMGPDGDVRLLASPGYRLPTEAEWEYACRAGTEGPRYGPLDAIAWYRDNAGEGPHEVGGKEPNAWGLHDMLGNVWNWCWDLYDPEVYGSYRVLRGGGWFDEHWSCRASVRRRSHPAFRVDDVGFRVARTLTR
ncbi:formylglycine-generating enzyme family protein [Actinoplanes sp. M2I2]|uniref:formylglycine-generating enzyme family protein n=1 Tax=Actinoplanes sp. M2I2 TaxID=1734444 RepID=UPI002021EEEF|nr:formylglycine-generating enzyme family protein [Actinoplanes sp. M2I2]